MNVVVVVHVPLNVKRNNVKNQHCNIICMDIGCQISNIRGPINGNLNIDCLGEETCINSAFKAAESLDVTCSGKDACKCATHM